LKIKFKPDGKVISTYFQVLRSISIGKKKEWMFIVAFLEVQSFPKLNSIKKMEGSLELFHYGS
jgi:hypothetical protein